MPIREYTWNPLTDSVIEETDGNGNALVTYTNKPEPFGPLVSQNRGGKTSHFHFDAQGSTRLLTDNTGAPTDSYTCDAWGNLRSKSGTSENDFLWIGRMGYQFDSATTEYYVRARVFRPAVGRWISIDPLLFDADPSSRPIHVSNPAWYVENRPGMDLDPSGTVIHVYAFEGAGAKAKASPKQLEIYFKPIADKYGELVKWHYSYQKAGNPIQLGVIAKGIIETAVNKEAECPHCYPRIVFLGFSWGANTVWKLVRGLHDAQPKLKVDAVLTIDPVFGFTWISGIQEGAETWGNFCYWESYYQTTDDGTLAGWDVRGDIIQGANNIEITDLGPSAAHLKIASDKRVIDAFDIILSDYARDQGPRRIDWKGDCPIRICFAK